MTAVSLDETKNSMDRCSKIFDVDAPESESMSSKCQSVAEVPSADSEESSDSRSRRCSFEMTSNVPDGNSREYASEHKRGRSAEPRLARETKNFNDVENVDAHSRSVGTYLVVPRQEQMSKTTHHKKSPSFVFSHRQNKLSLGQRLSSPLLPHDSLSETAVDTPSSAASNVTDWPDYSKFQVLESVLQQRSTPGVRDGFITSQKTASVDKIADNDCSSGANATPQKFASSLDLLDSSTNEHPFRVHEEHVAQQRMVSVEREQCTAKEKAAMSVVKGRNVPSRHHRAVTVSRSQTWSFRDKSKSEQLLREAGTVKTQDGKVGGSSEQLLDETSVDDFSFTVNRANRSKTLPHIPSSGTVRPLRHSLEEPPVSSAVHSCLLRDYDKDKDWSFVPWTDEPDQ